MTKNYIIPNIFKVSISFEESYSYSEKKQEIFERKIFDYIFERKIKE